MSLTRNYYEGDVTILDLKPGDKIVLHGSSNVYKIKNSKLAFSDKIFLTFEDGEEAGYCSDGEVSCANKLKYFHNIAKTIRGDTTNAQDMSWEELVEKAKKLGAYYDKEDVLRKCSCLFFYGVCFRETGIIDKNYFFVVRKNRTPSQMYQIMLALED